MNGGFQFGDISADPDDLLGESFSFQCETD
jgi:hypothetical protein